MRCWQDRSTLRKRRIAGKQADRVSLSASEARDARDLVQPLGVKRGRDGVADELPNRAWKFNAGLGVKSDEDHQCARRRDEGDRIGDAADLADRNLQLGRLEASSVDLDLPVFATDDIHNFL